MAASPSAAMTAAKTPGIRGAGRPPPAATYVAFAAVLLSLVQTYCPPSELQFATATLAACLVFFAAVADPAAFWATAFAVIPFLRWMLPKILREHIRKSIECLEEGERRVAALEKKKGDAAAKNKGKGEQDVTTKLILDEMRKRTQWRWIVPFAISGTAVKVIQYEKPKVLGQMMDAVVLEGATMDTAFWPFLRRLVLFVIFDYLFVSLREYCRHAAKHRYQADVRTDMLRNILDQEMDFLHAEHHSAGFVHLMNRETNRMQSLVNESLPRLFFGIVSVVGGVHALLRVDYRLALVGIFVKSPILAALQKMSRRDIVKYNKLYEASVGDAARLAQSILKPEVIHLLQSHVSQARLVERYRSKQDEFIRYLQSTHMRQTMLCMVHHGLRNVEDVLLLALGLSSVLQGKITLGEYTTFRSHLALLDQGPRELLAFWNDLFTIGMSAQSYFELMYRESKIPCSGGGNGRIPDESKEGLTISLNNVSFAYRLNPSVKVLQRVNLQLMPGKVVALCGGSGGGKTSITRLLQRFYDPTEGSITLNGVDIRSLDVSWLRTQIAQIDQDPTLPDLTILENIALGLRNEDSDKGQEYIRERVIEAAKLAEAHEFITDKCELGYDTTIRQIHRLSGGQRQRIAIARALITRAPILICDEVTSSLDAETEKVIIGTLFEAMRGKAVLVVAHRLSTIRAADEIVFLEHGEVVEKGTHTELMKLKGRYAGYVKTHRSC
ncbi:hypothetical protein ACHAXT_010907 [Thalassiosira profunda]